MSKRRNSLLPTYCSSWREASPTRKIVKCSYCGRRQRIMGKSLRCTACGHIDENPVVLEVLPRPAWNDSPLPKHSGSQKKSKRQKVEAMMDRRMRPIHQDAVLRAAEFLKIKNATVDMIVSSLETMLWNHPILVRIEAAGFLLCIGSGRHRKRSIKIIDSGLRNASPDVREASIRALGHLVKDSRRFLDRLRTLQSADPEEKVRQAAQGAIDNIQELLKVTKIRPGTTGSDKTTAPHSRENSKQQQKPRGPMRRPVVGGRPPLYKHVGIESREGKS